MRLTGLSRSCSSCLAPATCFSTSHFPSPPLDSSCLLALLCTLVALLLKFKKKKIKSCNMQRAPESNSSGIANSAKRLCQEGSLTSCTVPPVKRKREDCFTHTPITLAPLTLPGQQLLPACAKVSSIHTAVARRTPGDPSGNTSQLCIPQGHPFSQIFCPKEGD